MAGTSHLTVGSSLRRTEGDTAYEDEGKATLKYSHLNLRKADLQKYNFSFKKMSI